MWWNTLLFLLCFLAASSLIPVLTSPLSRPFMLPMTTEGMSTAKAEVDLDLQARLLSDELTCDFDNITYCGLHNNGGWSFKQSLLELVQQLSSTNVSISQLPSIQNHFVCADWGVTNQRIVSSSSMPSLSGSTEQVAALEVFLLPPSPRPLRQTNGKVFYVGKGPLESVSLLEEEKKETRMDFGVCLELDVRLSSENTDEPSKLTVKFRSMSQTIEASPMPITSPLPQPTERKVAFFSSLMGWILGRPSHGPVQQRQRQLRRITPPSDLWLHLILPLDIQLLPDSPLHFALYGQSGVCVDSLLVSRCSATTIPSLSWPPNNSMSLVRQVPSVLLFAPPSTKSASSFSGYHPLLTGAFFFACLLVILIALLIVIFAASIACGRKRRRQKRRRDSGSGVEKRGGAGGSAILTTAELLRSPSISSLPGAAVHQRPIDEILHCIDEDVVEKVADLDSDADHLHISEQGSLDIRRLRLKRPQRRPPRRTQSVDSRLQTGHQVPSHEAPRERSKKRGKKQHQTPLLSDQPKSHHRRGRGWRSMDAGTSVTEVTPHIAGQRLSLLLAINEDNELVLVTPGSGNASVSRNEVRMVSSSPSITTSGSSGTATTATTASSGSAATATTCAAVGAGGRLSSAETEAILQEMAESVAHLGTRRSGDDERDERSGDVDSSTTSSSAGLPPLYEEAIHMLSEQQQQQLQSLSPTSFDGS